MKGYRFTILAGMIFLGVLASCTFTQKVKTGAQAYEYKQYHLATQLLEEEYNQTNLQREKAQRAFLLGRAYAHMNDAGSSARWYEQAYIHEYGQEALRSYAEQLRKSEQYDDAIAAYQKLNAADQGNQQFRRMITMCQQAKEWQENREENPFIISETGINTPASEYAPLAIDAGRILISADVPQSTGDDSYLWTGRTYSDLFVADLDRNSVDPFDPEINTKHNEGTPTISNDGSFMVFVRCFSGSEYDSYCRLMQSGKTPMGWSKPEMIDFCKPGVNYGSPFLAPGDSVLFFSADDPEEGMGGYDIYWVGATDDGWGQPVLLPERINTEGNDNFPTLDGDTLYFSSDGHVGMGGLDIFKTYILPDGTWAPPENLKAPVNSGADDFYFMVDPFFDATEKILQRGYLTSSRVGGEGSDDIYIFEKHHKAPEVVATGEEAEKDKPVKYEIYLAVKVVEPVFEDPADPNSRRIGIKPLANARLSVSQGVAQKLLGTDENGYIVMQLDFEKDYLLTASYKGHLSQERSFSTQGIVKDPEHPVQTHNITMVLDPIFKGKEIVLENIYYDFDQWYIRPDARPTLDSLAKLLKVNPEVRIQLSSHTDCRGDETYNMELSQKRAQSAVTYLIESGINASRLVARGYGESQLLIDCSCDDCTEEEHQQNRRTTFKVID